MKRYSVVEDQSDRGLLRLILIRAMTHAPGNIFEAKSGLNVSIRACGGKRDGAGGA